ncbi:MAG: hypothetical protein KME45_18545 [Stenomitos rutilans HA7619-LM2]|jgi:hypothetical protein|nr:hypothetical protein [Stenomitos rutilans HA7619-LM2]
MFGYGYTHKQIQIEESPEHAESQDGFAASSAVIDVSEVIRKGAIDWLTLIQPRLSKHCLLPLAVKGVERKQA